MCDESDDFEHRKGLTCWYFQNGFFEENEYDDIELSLKHKDKIKIYEDKVKLLKFPQIL